MRGLRWLTQSDYQFYDTELSGAVKFAYHALAIDEQRAPFEPTLWIGEPKPGQTIEQVWFCGVHSDVGGGYAESELSDIPLNWMMDKARRAGLVFDAEALAAYPLHPNPTAPEHRSKTGLYLFTPDFDRPIGLNGTTADATQTVHESVRKRWDTDPSYRPPGLRHYFRRIGDPRGAAAERSMVVVR